jgi:4-amino-4-deoxychorismate lyase
VPLEQLFPSELPTAPASRSPGEDWKIVLDEAPTAPSPFTSFKTTARKMYDDARTRAWIQNFAEKKEVLLWNEKHEVMEGSLTSVFVFKNGEWVTPAMDSGGQRGTTRRWALEKGLAKEGLVKTGDVRKGSWVVVSNGVRGIWGGWVA